MNWYESTLVSFDTETTGVDVANDRIVTASIVTIDPMTGCIQKQEWLLDPGVDIPTEATAVHGITTEMARTGGRPAGECVHEIRRELWAAWEADAPVIIYNASYDLSLLDRELARHDYIGLGLVGSVIDPLVRDKHYDRYRKGSRKLTAVAAHYGITLSEQDAHGATADALASARVAWKLAKKYPALGGMDLVDLQDAQASWHAEQAAGLQEYFDKKGIDERVSLDWPVRMVTA